MAFKKKEVLQAELDAVLAQVEELKEQQVKQGVLTEVSDLVSEGVSREHDRQESLIMSLMGAIPAFKARYRVSQWHVVDLTGKLNRALKRNRKLGEKLAAEKAKNAVLKEVNNQLMSRSVTVSSDGTVEA